MYDGHQVQSDPRTKHGIPYRLISKRATGEGSGVEGVESVYTSSPLGDDTPSRALTGGEYTLYTKAPDFEVNALKTPFTSNPGVDPEIEGDEV